jgi:hypothetical protein
MSKRLVGLVAVVMAVVVAIGFMVVPSSTPEAVAKGKNQFQMDLILAPGPGPDGTSRISTSGTIELTQLSLAEAGYNVDSFFDVMYVSNIGSSGEDGVSFKSSPTFDVFFEVDYKTSRGSGFATEMISMSLKGSIGDGTVTQRGLDVVRKAVEKNGGHTYVGHVTLIR